MNTINFRYNTIILTKFRENASSNFKEVAQAEKKLRITQELFIQLKKNTQYQFQMQPYNLAKFEENPFGSFKGFARTKKKRYIMST